MRVGDLGQSSGSSTNPSAVDGCTGGQESPPIVVLLSGAAMEAPVIERVAWLDEWVNVHGGFPPTRYSCRKCGSTLANYLQTDDALVEAVKEHIDDCPGVSGGFGI